MSTPSGQAFEGIAPVVEHELFPEVDLALRRGRHIDRDDAEWYAFLTDAQAELERFYRRYGAELVQRTDGFFFLLPTGDKLGRRHLSAGEMLVGQGLTLLYLDPASIEQGGITSRDAVLSQLSASMGTEQLMLAFNAKKKRMDERVAQELVRARVSEAIRRLAGLGFVELLPDERIRLRAALMRFAEPVRGNASELEALSKLVASGEVALGQDDAPIDSDAGGTGEGEAAADDALSAAAAWTEGATWGDSFAAEAAEEPPGDDSASNDSASNDSASNDSASNDSASNDSQDDEEPGGEEPGDEEPGDEEQPT
jgi:chromosome partition protein MukE